MTNTIASGDQVTPAWLTEILRQSGMLQQGEVIRIEQQKSGAFNSQLTFLQLHYSGDAKVNEKGSELPRRLVLVATSLIAQREFGCGLLVTQCRAFWSLPPASAALLG